MSNNIMFILFPGHLGSDYYWKKKINRKGNVEKSDFYNKLKKLGKVYSYVPKVNNICYYHSAYKKSDRGFKRIDSITMDDLSIEKQCVKLYEEIKDFKGFFIPIGHSIGSWYCIQFSRMYPQKCKCTILLDPSFITPKIYRKTHKKESNFLKYGKIMTENKWNNLISKIINHTNSNKKLYLIENEYFNSIIKHYMKTVDKFDGTLTVPNLSFVNLSINIKNQKLDSSFLMNRYTILEQIELKKYNNNKQTTIYLVNSTHKPWYIPSVCDEIIDHIEMYLGKINKNKSNIII